MLTYCCRCLLIAVVAVLIDLDTVHIALIAIVIAVIIELLKLKGVGDMKNHKLHFCTSIVTTLLSVVTLLLMVTGEETVLACSFFMYLLFILLLTANLASYLTVLWYQRKQLKRRDLIYTCVFLVANISFMFLYFYLITIFYFFN